MKSVLVWLAALAVAGCEVRAEPPAPYSQLRVEAAAVPLDPADPARTQMGAFTYVGGLILKSPDTSRLHGLSGFKIVPDGGFLAVSDDGDLVRARLLLEPGGAPAGLAEASIDALKDQHGAVLTGKAQGDAEDIAVWPNGDLMVSFERNDRILLYPADGAPPRLAPSPPIRMADNMGMEGLALAPSRGPDAYWVGLEGGAIWLCRLSGGCESQVGVPKPPIQLMPPYVFRLSGLVEAPSGELVVLHHGFNGIDKSRLRLLILRMQPGAPPRVLDTLVLNERLNIDNFEGVDVVARPGGGLRIVLLTDDNFSDNKPTLLTTFDWQPSRRTVSASGRASR